LRRGAAVDDEAGAGHEGVVVGREKDDAFGNVVRRAEPADRVGRERAIRRAATTSLVRPVDKSLVAHVRLNAPGWIEFTNVNHIKEG
jgi:hypothetical protein